MTEHTWETEDNGQQHNHFGWKYRHKCSRCGVTYQSHEPTGQTLSGMSWDDCDEWIVKSVLHD